MLGSDLFRRGAWKSEKRGLRYSTWATRSQRQRVKDPSSGSRVHNKVGVGSKQNCNTQVGLQVLSNPKPIGPFRMDMSESSLLSDPSDPSLSNHEAQASAIPHEASVARVGLLDHRDELTREIDTTSASGLHTEESPASLEKAGSVRFQASEMARSSAGQTEVMGHPVESPVKTQCTFSGGFHTTDSSATLDRANTALIHTTRMDTRSLPLNREFGLPCDNLGGG